MRQQIFLMILQKKKILQKLFEYRDKTIISISHRKNSLKNFNKIFEIRDMSLNKINID